MAAETLVAKQATTYAAVPAAGDAFNIKAAVGVYNIAANTEAGDIFEMCKVPAGAVVVGGWLMGADLDTGIETLDLDVGWKASTAEVTDPDGFGNFGVVTGDVSVHLPVAGIYLPLQGVLLTAGPKKFAAETVLQVTANAASATGGTGYITLVALFFIDPNFSAT